MDNFSTKVGKAICTLGVIGGLVSGKAFETAEIIGTYYQRVERSYNWGVALSVMVSMAIIGALFISLGQIYAMLVDISNNTSSK